MALTGDLIARLEGAKAGSRELDRLVHNARGDRPPISAEELAADDRLESFFAEYTTSMSAARALLPAHHGYSVRWNCTSDGDVEYANCQVWPYHDPRDEDAPRWWASAATEPLAMCAAILKAREEPA